MRYPYKIRGYLPVQAVGSEDTLLANHDLIRGYIAHRESKPVDVFRYDVHPPGAPFSTQVHIWD